MSFRKHHSARRAVAGNAAGQQEVERNPGLGIAHAAAARKLLHPAAPERVRLELGEAFGREQKVDVRGRPTMAMRVHGHATGDRVGDAQLLELLHDARERPVHFGRAHEEPPEFFDAVGALAMRRDHAPMIPLPARCEKGQSAAADQVAHRGD
jgi:hypothetical protein